MTRHFGNQRFKVAKSVKTTLFYQLFFLSLLGCESGCIAVSVKHQHSSHSSSHSTLTLNLKLSSSQGWSGFLLQLIVSLYTLEKKRPFVFFASLSVGETQRNRVSEAYRNEDWFHILHIHPSSLYTCQVHLLLICIAHFIHRQRPLTSSNKKWINIPHK